MIYVSDDFKNAMYGTDRAWLEKITITLKDDTILKLTESDIWLGGLTLSDAISSDSSFDIGSTIINSAEIVINNIEGTYDYYDFDGADVLVQVGLVTDKDLGTAAYITKGHYTVDTASYDGALVTLKCLDYMAKFDKEYSNSQLVYPASLLGIVQDACRICDVSLASVTFPHRTTTIPTKPNDETLTFRQIIGYVAQMIGRNARINKNGALEFVKYDETTATEHDITDYTFSRTFSFDDVVITQIKIRVTNTATDATEAYTEFSEGTEGYSILIENNPLITALNASNVLSWLSSDYIGLRFARGSISHLSDPTFEAGDMGTAKGRTFLVSSTTFNSKNRQSTVSSAEEPARNSAARSSEATKNYVLMREQLINEKTDREQAIEQLVSEITNSGGVYVTEISDGAGGTIIYLHNQPTLAESKVVWKITADGWLSTTNYSGNDDTTTWEAGLTAYGDAIMRVLNVVGINAEWIKTGTLTVGGGGTDVPYIIIKDANDDEIGRIDEEGIVLVKDDTKIRLLANNGFFEGLLFYAFNLPAFQIGLDIENNIAEISAGGSEIIISNDHTFIDMHNNGTVEIRADDLIHSVNNEDWTVSRYKILDESMIITGSSVVGTDSTNISTGTDAEKGTFTLDAGTYSVTITVIFSTNSTGYRRAWLSSASGGRALNRTTEVHYAATSSGSSQFQFTTYLKPTTRTTYHLVVNQDSGSTIRCSATVSYMGIKA